MVQYPGLWSLDHRSTFVKRVFQRFQDLRLAVTTLLKGFSFLQKFPEREIGVPD